MFAPPFADALARGGGSEVLCSNILIEQKMQPMARVLIAITNTHINPPVVLPTSFTLTSADVVLEIAGTAGLPSGLSLPVISSTAFHARTRTASSAVSLKTLLWIMKVSKQWTPCCHDSKYDSAEGRVVSSALGTKHSGMLEIIERKLLSCYVIVR